MHFELDNTLTDEILFCMENQDSEFLLDTREGIIIDLDNDVMDDTDTDEDRYISLPEWGSQEGYRLMENFTSSLKNPVIRQELSAALNRNKGVFRAFRNVLEQYPETEKLWFRFKESKMKNEIIYWYNALREEWGLQPIGIEPEDNSSIVLEDFVIRKGETDFHFLAETANGEQAGSIQAIMNPDSSVLHVNTLEVNNIYRCLGIGKMLLTKLLETADEKKLDVTIDLPCESAFFSRSLLLENFKPGMQRFIRSNGT